MLERVENFRVPKSIIDDCHAMVSIVHAINDRKKYRESFSFNIFNHLPTRVHALVSECAAGRAGADAACSTCRGSGGCGGGAQMMHSFVKDERRCQIALLLREPPHRLQQQHWTEHGFPFFVWRPWTRPEQRSSWSAAISCEWTGGRGSCHGHLTDRLSAHAVRPEPTHLT